MSMIGYRIPVMVCLVLLAGSMLAQKAKYTATRIDDKAAQTKSRPHVKAYLGHSDLNDGPVSKHIFDSLLRQGLTAKDSLGNLFKVDGFTFSYGAHNLYEDSVGNPIILTDYFSEVCIGDTISRGVAINVYEYNMTKAGDTAYFENIRVSSPEAGQMLVKPMRFVLRK